MISSSSANHRGFVGRLPTLLDRVIGTRYPPAETPLPDHYGRRFYIFKVTPSPKQALLGLNPLSQRIGDLECL